MALAAKPVMRHHPNRLQKKSSTTSNNDVKRAANMYMNKLTDRDTEAMAASELDSMARSLPADSIPPFLSAISDTRSSDKTPLRRHCVRLLSLLSQSHSPQSLFPLLPRMVSAIRSRLRDPDSSVRTACVDAVRSISSSAISNPSSPPSSAAIVFRPFCESLLLEQDHNAQIGSAMCVAAAVEGLGFEISADVQRLVPRLVKLAKSEAFKAKPALLSLFGSIIAAGGAPTPALLGVLVPCLIDFLGNDDWATRKAAAEALSRVASIPDGHLLANFKSSCISTYESRRFDKVKIVRESMNQMLEAWKNLPGSVGDDNDDDDTYNALNSQGNSSRGESANHCHFSTGSRISSSIRSNNGYRGNSATSGPANSRSPPPEALSVCNTSRKNPSSLCGRRTSPPMFRKLDNKKPSVSKVQISVPQTQTHEVLSEYKETAFGSNAGSRFEPKQVLLEDISEDKSTMNSNSKEAMAGVPVQAKELSLSPTGISNATDELYINHKESNELSLIHNQLAQIEKQQSSLLDLLQRLIGSSQNGIRSLETRVHGLEMALDKISQDLAVSTGKTSEPSDNACCKLPGTEFLSSRFWRKTEGKYSSRLSISSTSALTDARNQADKESMSSSKWDGRFHGIQGGFIENPLAEVDSSRGYSHRHLKNSLLDTGPSPAQD